MNEKLNEYPEMWDGALTGMSQFIQEYHTRMLDSISNEAPIFYFRYEDLLSNPQQTLEDIFSFLLEVESVEGLNV